MKKFIFLSFVVLLFTITIKGSQWGVIDSLFIAKINQNFQGGRNVFIVINLDNFTVQDGSIHITDEEKQFITDSLFSDEFINLPTNSTFMDNGSLDSYTYILVGKGKTIVWDEFNKNKPWFSKGMEDLCFLSPTINKYKSFYSTTTSNQDEKENPSSQPPQQQQQQNPPQQQQKPSLSFTNLLQFNEQFNFGHNITLAREKYQNDTETGLLYFKQAFSLNPNETIKDKKLTINYGQLLDSIDRATLNNFIEKEIKKSMDEPDVLISHYHLLGAINYNPNDHFRLTRKYFFEAIKIFDKYYQTTSGLQPLFNHNNRDSDLPGMPQPSSNRTVLKDNDPTLNIYVGILFNMASVYRGMKQLEISLRFTDRLLSIHPNNISILLLYSQTVMEFGLFNKAKEALDRILQLSPNNTAAKILLGECYIHLENYRESYYLIKPLINPVDSKDLSVVFDNQVITMSFDPIVHSGSMLLRELAESSINSNENFDSKFTLILPHKLKIEEEIRSKDIKKELDRIDLANSLTENDEYDHAISSLKKINQLYKSCPDVYFFLGYCYSNQYRYNEAVDSLETLLSILKSKDQFILWRNPEKKDIYISQAYYFLTLSLMSLGNYEKAIDYAEKGILQFPNDSLELYEMLGILYSKYSKNYEKGKLNLTKSLEIDPTSKRSLITLAELELEEGEYQESLTHFEKALDLIQDIQHDVEQLDLTYRCYMGLGELSMLIKNYPKSMEFFEEAYSLRHTNKSLEKCITICILNNEPEKASNLIPQEFEVDDEGQYLSPSILLGLAKELISMGDSTEAFKKIYPKLFKLILDKSKISDVGNNNNSVMMMETDNIDKGELYYIASLAGQLHVHNLFSKHSDEIAPHSTLVRFDIRTIIDQSPLYPTELLDKFKFLIDILANCKIIKDSSTVEKLNGVGSINTTSDKVDNIIATTDMIESSIKSLQYAMISIQSFLNSNSFNNDSTYINDPRIQAFNKLSKNTTYLILSLIQQNGCLWLDMEVTARACNFLEIGSTGSNLFDKDTKVIYRHFATLYFIFCVDSAESELSIIDLIQSFVESLDKCFESVCELDLIFHIDKVHYILDEVVMGGLVLETNPVLIVSNYEASNKFEKSDNPLISGFQGVFQTIKPK
eukprot:gene9264-11356_t